MTSKLSKISSAIKRRLIPRDAHSSLRLWLTGPLEDHPPTLISEFDASPVLVLAPHADDEVIGPGGTILRHIAAGAPVTVVILTDGRWGGFDPDGKLVEHRKEESRNAAKILGFPEPIFFDAPDGNLGETPEVVPRLAKLITEKSPKFIYLPAITDGHPDHWSTNVLLQDALSQLPANVAASMMIRGYEVWTPTFANCCVDTTSVMDLKEKGIKAFPTQIAENDYVAAARGLGKYRSLQHLHGRGYAEAFMQMTSDDFRRIFASASLRSSAE